MVTSSLTAIAARASLRAGRLLTIIVPTYNRADHLERLLSALHYELRGHDDDVTVLVSDNASTDRTPELTRSLQEKWPALAVQRHDDNIGAERNFCSGVARVDSRYFWIVGDDDCPKAGVIPRLLALMREHEPTLVYMQSEWLNPVTGPTQGMPVGDLQVRWLDAATFARKVHVWLTFISGVVVRRERLQEALAGEPLDRFVSTQLVQLGWIVPLLRSAEPSERFAFIVDACVLATKDNSGGYGLLTTFGTNFARIVTEVLGKTSAMRRSLIDGNLAHYLPGLVWGTRSSTASRHATEDAWPGMRRQLGDRLMFWLVLLPIGRLPRWMAQPFFQSWRVYHRLHLECTKLAARWHRARRPV
jgi:abequosyltransferase